MINNINYTTLTTPNNMSLLRELYDVLGYGFSRTICAGCSISTYTVRIDRIPDTLMVAYLEKCIDFFISHSMMIQECNKQNNHYYISFHLEEEKYKKLYMNFYLAKEDQPLIEELLFNMMDNTYAIKNQLK